MWFDLREFYLQLRALVKICVCHPNSWREIAIAVIAVAFLPLVVLVCLLANAKYSFSATPISDSAKYAGQITDRAIPK